MEFSADTCNWQQNMALREGRLHSLGINDCPKAFFPPAHVEFICNYFPHDPWPMRRRIVFFANSESIKENFCVHIWWLHNFIAFKKNYCDCISDEVLWMQILVAYCVFRFSKEILPLSKSNGFGARDEKFWRYMQSADPLLIKSEVWKMPSLSGKSELIIRARRNFA